MADQEQPPVEVHHITNPGPKDATSLATCLLAAYSRTPQPDASLLAKLFPETDAVHSFLRKSLIEQFKREPGAIWIKAVLTPDGRSQSNTTPWIGFVKFVPPWEEGETEHAETYWADYVPEMDAGLCDALFGAMHEHRAALMGHRRHWWLEIIGVHSDYQHHHVGDAMLAKATSIIDEADPTIESYVDATPVGVKLYERYGFEKKASKPMPEPYEWFVLSFLVRQPPGKVPLAGAA